MCKKTTKPSQQNNVFQDAMKGVERIHHDRVLHDTPKPRAIPLKTTNDKQQDVRDFISDEYEPVNVLAGDVLSYRVAGVQKKVFRKLRAGHYRITDELDLHGMNAKQAKEALLGYLHSVEQLESSCIRIIHGKGNRSENKSSVLKRKVDHWLQLHGRVLAYHSTLPKDGGTGAVYVLLKRQY